MMAQARPVPSDTQIDYSVSETEHTLLTDTRDELLFLARLSACAYEDTSISVFALSRQYQRLAGQLTDVLDSCVWQR